MSQDATANDAPSDLFDVQGFPTIYLYSGEGVVIPYDGDRTKEDIIKFINDKMTKPETGKETTVGDLTAPVGEIKEETGDGVKDEL